MTGPIKDVKPFVQNKVLDVLPNPCHDEYVRDLQDFPSVPPVVPKPDLRQKRSTTMSLIVKDRVFEQMSEGLHNVTITKVEDLGLQETKFGTKDQARIFFTAQDQKTKDGQPVDVPMTVTTTSLHPKSKLAKLLNSLGITANETFDLNSLVGVKCQVVIETNANKETGKEYASIATVLKNRKPAQEV